MQSFEPAQYIKENCFVVLGLSGVGKSLFINAISGTDCCMVGSSYKSCNQVVALVNFVYNNHKMTAIDTPGLDDSKENLEVLKNFLKYIKKIIIVKKYNDIRLNSNLISALFKIFPFRNLWEHVIIVNTFANPHDENFNDYMKETHEYFVDKIKNCENLKKIMSEKNIKIPTKLKEYFVCSKSIKKNKEIGQEFNMIKEEIINSMPMFKKVNVSSILEKSRKSEKNKGFYIITKYRIITCIDFDNRETKTENILEQKEVTPQDCKLIRTEEELVYDENDEVRWYDIATIGIARAIRNTKKYKVYKVHIYQVGDQEIKGPRIYLRTEYL